MEANINTNKTKPFYLSKAVWVFFILFIASILNATGIVQLELNENATWLIPIISIIGLILRIITKEPINW